MSWIWIFPSVSSSNTGGNGWCVVLQIMSLSYVQDPEWSFKIKVILLLHNRLILVLLSWNRETSHRVPGWQANMSPAPAVQTWVPCAQMGVRAYWYCLIRQKQLWESSDTRLVLNLNTESINCTVNFHSVIVLNFAISNREMFIFLNSCTLHHFKKNLNAEKTKQNIVGLNVIVWWLQHSLL